MTARWRYEPDNAEVLNNRGVLLTELDRFEEAWKAATGACGKARLCRCALQSRQCSARLKRFEDAGESYRRRSRSSRAPRCP